MGIAYMEDVLFVLLEIQYERIRAPENSATGGSSSGTKCPPGRSPAQGSHQGTGAAHDIHPYAVFLHSL